MHLVEAEVAIGNAIEKVRLADGIDRKERLVSDGEEGAMSES